MPHKSGEAQRQIDGIRQKLRGLERIREDCMGRIRVEAERIREASELERSREG